MKLWTPEWLSKGMSATHRRALSSCHPMLQLIYDRIAPGPDANVFFYVYTGHRDEFSQNEAYRAGKSAALWGQSWHNLTPALAFDGVPIWKDNPRRVEWQTQRTHAFLKQMAESAADLLLWGGTFKNLDRVHFQMMRESKPPAWAVDGYRLTNRLEKV